MHPPARKLIRLAPSPAWSGKEDPDIMLTGVTIQTNVAALSCPPDKGPDKRDGAA